MIARPRPRSNFLGTRTALIAALALGLAAPASGARDVTLPGAESVRFELTRVQDVASPTEEGEAPPLIRKRYGAAGTEWIIAGATGAYDFDNNTDVALSIGYSRFLADDVEWVLDLSAWYHRQEGDDAASLNPAMEFRWHVWNIDHTSAFLNIGIGVLGATDNVPDLGTGFNFTPRIGAGLTHQISDGGARLIGGVRWHHISNARINGEDRNPSRDAPGFYLQVAFPF